MQNTVGIEVRPTGGNVRLRQAFVITRRELRDSLRDWRIVVPIVILTLVFPFLMDFTAAAARNFVVQYGGENAIIAERLNPFLLMIVGFFPISISLVIALETFVGEKERNSIEPLLSMPVSDTELYIGKMLAALMIPLGASYLGVAAYLTGLYVTMAWFPPVALLVQMLLLTSVEALVMVSGAVIVSSQTTSVRAANLLASFIVIPMALLVQTQSILMFWGRYNVIWWVIVGLVIVDLILIRMGVLIFNREEILSREIDEFNLRSIWRDFAGYFLRPPELAEQRDTTVSPPLNIKRLYLHDIPRLIRLNWKPLVVLMVALVGSCVLGAVYAAQYPIPEGMIQLDSLPRDAFENLPDIGFLPSFSVPGVFFNNIRSLFLAAVLAVLSFGVLSIILLMIPMALVAFFAAEVGMLGSSPWLFLTAFILPHGIIELPAAIVATAFALQIGAALISPPKGLNVGQGFLLSLANFCKVFLFVVVPLMLAAAVLEVHVTPHVVLAFYGAG